ncbi:MAG: thioesterase family protein [Paenibacillaceae bacterium]
MISLIRVQFKDVDLSRRIHYSALFRFFEQADHELFRSIGFSYKELIGKKIQLPRVNVACDYMGVINYDDVLELHTIIEHIGNSSFRYRFEFYKEEVLVALGKMTIVFTDDTIGKSIKIPDEIRKELEKRTLQD